MTGRYQIRKYRPQDADAVLRIAADTAMLGRPVEVAVEDRRLFQDAMYRDYLESEPDLILVAENPSGDVAGFILGSIDTAARERRLRRYVYPRVLLKLLTMRYHLGRRWWHTTSRLLQPRAWREHLPAPDLARFPAHLHLNIAASARGAGLGRALLQEFLALLRSRGAPGVHLTTTRHNEAACRLWERAGFELAAAAPVGAWSVLLGRPVQGRLYTKVL